MAKRQGAAWSKLKCPKNTARDSKGHCIKKAMATRVAPVSIGVARLVGARSTAMVVSVRSVDFLKLPLINHGSHEETTKCKGPDGQGAKLKRTHSSKAGQKLGTVCKARAQRYKK